MVKQVKGNLHQLARLAKDRLRENSYLAMPSNVVPFRQKIQKTFAELSHNAQRKPQEEAFKKVTVINSFDEVLYKRVCDMLKSNSAINPIGELIDRKVFNNLDFEAKQRYLNMLNLKYKELKSRYFKENLLSFSY